MPQIQLIHPKFKNLVFCCHLVDTIRTLAKRSPIVNFPSLNFIIHAFVRNYFIGRRWLVAYESRDVTIWKWFRKHKLLALTKLNQLLQISGKDYKGTTRKNILAWRMVRRRSKRRSTVMEGLTKAHGGLRRSKRKLALKKDDTKIYGEDYGILPSDWSHVGKYFFIEADFQWTAL